MSGRREERRQAAGLAARLRHVVAGEVDDDTRRRAEYSTDASNYRVVPEVVVFPAAADDVLATLETARSSGVAVTARGGGTSVAGNAIGPGVVLDFSRHLGRMLSLDADAGTATVEPGMILADLQRAAAPHGLRFGPDPSTHSRATLAGMIGNNACGPHAVAYGRTADNVRSLDVVDGTGRRFTAAADVDAVPGLRELVGSRLDVLRTELGRFPRQVSGYSLEHLLPERGHSLAKALVGTEGTVAITLAATVDLVPITPARVLVVLGYPTMPDAADAVPRLLAHCPLAVEGLDARLIDVVRRHRGAAAVPALPRGGGWLMVEVGGADTAAAEASVRALLADAEAVDAVVLPAGAQAAAMWRIREDGAGLAGRTPGGRQAWPGWEDAAVPPERLGAYLREFESLMDSYGVEGLPYGHFGDGCVHVRLGIPLERDGSVLRAFVTDAARLTAAHGGSFSGEHGDGRARGELLPLMYSQRVMDVFAGFKALLDPDDVLNPGIVVRPRAVDADLRRPRALPLLAADGFAFAADDGDLTRAVHRCVGVGRCRADDSAAGGFMCPSFLATRDEKDSTRGRARVLQDLARGSLISGGWAAEEVHESLDLCLSCKACASDCPAEVDMARYKSEVLHRRYAGRLRPASHYSLGRLPLWLSILHRLGRIGPTLVNAVFAAGPLRRLLLAPAGVDSRRRVPRLAAVPFRRWWQRRYSRPTLDFGGAATEAALGRVAVERPALGERPPLGEGPTGTGSTGAEATGVKSTGPGPAATKSAGAGRATGGPSTPRDAEVIPGDAEVIPGDAGLDGSPPAADGTEETARSAARTGRRRDSVDLTEHDARPPVVLWVDTFTDGFDPAIARAAVDVLGRAGLRVIVPARQACCGLTWISTGQLPAARRRLRELLSILGPYAAHGVPVVGLEPSCLAVLRSDLIELLPDDPRAHQVARAATSLAELLTERSTSATPWRPPDLTGVTVLAQPHCHQHAVYGYETDLALLAAAGARTTRLAGCCGLAGNFGMERGHHDVSVAVAENALLPALREHTEDVVFLADGFSCRTQAEQLAGVRGVHLAQLLARGVDDRA
ncbi:FAD/FMN-containing dehydrogenase/Fe-S oxidoreductase [Actinoalloteichus hoggarensis]|uniref:Putative FAD-linked oxidoreductase n=1 Tax=Actinoalloteichus hoggarensis TaxID=1470176 RepID=A0A221W644_9PSEU|nr:FAD-binding and (Fe-S)-binding domain-containing protein [Actinoalloteichus hoggarensis]ASO21181.1 putative FAD-linked oxidoreductase [Actinoalloteichus hoggarensis]MBB5921110.1 FAD/FMN-containing dehydrogenase/Fe-S oxidoreductase [Actinoalloteichus hoggarensis]